MQLQLLDPLDLVVLLPAPERRTVRAARQETMKDREEDRPLHGEAELPAVHQLLDHVLAAGLLPEPLERHDGPEATRRRRPQLTALMLGEDQHRLRQPAAGGQKRVEVT